MSLRRTTAAALAATLLVAPEHARAEDDLAIRTELENIEDLSLTELLERDVVAASRYQQRSSDSPVLVSTVTAEEIEVHAYRVIADALPTLSGVYVANDRAYGYVGVRGFGIPGDYNTRVYLSIGGHNMADPIYGQAPIGREAGIPAEAIERIEMVRGAAYSVYGAGALLGVIHVVPRSGKSRPGLHASASTAMRAETFGDPSGRRAIGNFGQELSATYGHAGDDVDVFVAASALVHPGLDRMYFPELDGLPDGECTDPSLAPRPCDGIVRGADDETAASAYGVLRTGGWTVQALAAMRDKRIPTASFDSTPGDPGEETRDFRAFADATYTRRRGALTFTGHAAADHWAYRGAYPSVEVDDDGTPRRSLYDDRATSIWLTADARVHWHRDAAGPHLRDLELVGGADATVVPYGHQYTAPSGQPADLDRVDQDLRAGVFGEASARIAGRVVLTGGLRAAHLDDAAAVHPRIAAMLDGGERGRLRGSFGTAHRAPNLYERYYWAAQPDDSLRAERSHSLELSGERYLTERVRLQVTGFHQAFSDLIALTTATDGRYLFGNVASARGYGLEAELEGEWDAVAVRLDYAWQHTRDGNDALLANSPSSLVGATVAVPLAGGRAVLGAQTRYVGRRLAGTGGSVPPWFLTSAALTVPHLRGPVGGAVGVNNLFDEDTADPAGLDHRQTAVPGNPRTVWLRLGIGL